MLYFVVVSKEKNLTLQQEKITAISTRVYLLRTETMFSVVVGSVGVLAGFDEAATSVLL